MKKLIILCIMVVLIVVGANMYAPQIAEAGLYQALSGKMDIEPGDVHVNASRGLKVLKGDLDSITVHGKNFAVGDLRFESFDCDLKGIHFSPADSLMNQQLTMLHADSGEMTASIRSDDLKTFLTQKVNNLSDVSVIFSDDAVQVRGTVKLGGILTAQAIIQGSFGMNGNKLMFIPSNVIVEGMGMTFNGTRLGSTEIYDFSTFPLGIRPDSVTLHDNVLTIHGRVSNT